MQAIDIANKSTNVQDFEIHFRIGIEPNEIDLFQSKSNYIFIGVGMGVHA